MKKILVVLLTLIILTGCSSDKPKDIPSGKYSCVSRTEDVKIPDDLSVSFGTKNLVAGQGQEIEFKLKKLDDGYFEIIANNDSEIFKYDQINDEIDFYDAIGVPSGITCSK